MLVESVIVDEIAVTIIAVSAYLSESQVEITTKIERLFNNCGTKANKCNGGFRLSERRGRLVAYRRRRATWLGGSHISTELVHKSIEAQSMQQRV